MLPYFAFTFIAGVLVGAVLTEFGWKRTLRELEECAACPGREARSKVGADKE